MKIINIFILILLFAGNIFSQTANFRDSVNVTHYEINLEIGDYQNQQIGGNTKLTICPVFDNTQNIKLDLFKMSVDSIYFNDKKIASWKYNEEIIDVNLSNKIDKKDSIELTIFYNGKPQKDKRWGGFYFSQKDAFNMGVGMSAYPHSFGRVWYPCVDIFTDKATYNYFITVNNNRTAVCSGLLKEIIDNKNNTKTYHWQLKNEIPTYLSSVAVSNYELFSKTYNGIEQEIPTDIYVFKNKTIKAEKSFQNLHDAVRIFEEKFGAYSWERIGYVETSFNAGAMEHATNITYPSYAINGTLKNQDLFVHELSHSWFGNLVTCKTPEDMWLNEGWASYCEALFREIFYDKENYKNYVRENHFKVLTNTHLRDGQYFSVYGIPHNKTYGSTVYDKGADVVHCLRGYMGDSLFFASAKNYLQEFAYKNTDTEDLKNSFSKTSGIDLTDFFNFWIYSKGFNFFEIINYKNSKEDGKYYTEVEVKQRLIASENFSNSNRLEIFFMDKDMNFEKRIFEFSGELGKNIYELPFEPIAVYLDLEEKTSDATVDNYKFINTKGSYEFDATLVDIKLLSIVTKSFLRVQTCWIQPENTNKKYTLNSHYWKVEGATNETFDGEIKFYYKNKYYKDKFSNNKDNIILLHRSSPKDKWKEVKSDNIQKAGYISCEINFGEYVFATKK